MNSAEVLIKFKGDTSSADKATNSMTASVSKLASSFTLGALAAKGISKAINVMTASMDSAITRVDTMNNFPKVMSNLGISAEESAAVIDDLGEKLKGLPTTLDAAAMAVQRFTSKNGDVKESEKLFLAVNNAILAGGASPTIQANALEQLSQAYAKGKPDMMEWRSLMTAMPAQLKQVAIAMGYTDAAMLGEAVRSKEGATEFAHMMDVMMQMNTEGVAGFKSFDEQARNATGGIQTSITNMKTAFVRGVADMITKVDESLSSFGGLNGVISTIGKFGEEAFKKIGDVLTWVIPKVIEIGQWIKNNEAWIKPLTVAVLAFVAGFKTVSIIISIINAAKTAFALFNAVLLANPIGIIVGAIAALIAVFIYLWNNCEAFRNFWIGLWEGIQNVFSAVVDAIKNFLIGLALRFLEFINNLKIKINQIKGFFNNLVNNIAQVPGKILHFFTSLPGKMANIGLDIVKGIGRGITNGIGWIKNQIKNFVGNVTNFIKKMFKIGSPSKLMANQVGQWIPKGIGVGIDANTDSVYDSMEEIQKTISSTFGLSSNIADESALHYSPSINVINNVDVSTDPLGQTVRTIKTFSGGSKNDYNYGMGV